MREVFGTQGPAIGVHVDYRDANDAPAAARQHRLASLRLIGTVRVGVVENVAGGSLPSALGRFATLNPGREARGADRGQRGIGRTTQRRAA
jgi:hypothetical protein